LPDREAIAIVPAFDVTDDRVSVAEPAERQRLRRLRLSLSAVVGGLVLVFGVAIWLNPYDRAGRPLRLATHQQLGLPPCTFYALTGWPCPSCGMTTSFALLVRGDVVNSLKANAVGTLLALAGLALIPWGLASVVRGRLLAGARLARLAPKALILFVVLMTVRWCLVLVLG
jgi:Protein of unknown function (DUF2752)